MTDVKTRNYTPKKNTTRPKVRKYTSIPPSEASKRGKTKFDTKDNFPSQTQSTLNLDSNKKKTLKEKWKNRPGKETVGKFKDWYQKHGELAHDTLEGLKGDPANFHSTGPISGENKSITMARAPGDSLSPAERKRLEQLTGFNA